ncbi:transposase [Leptospira yanagawae serovar Saopaulo str. Sao Paulo = ATCC 700523]|uniref:Transposase n=2 Tax=Leptospira TaxID=171 RepID=A0A5E8HDV0_9LEPT|nr:MULTISPECIES: transposase [Leptospira]EOQ86902.1 transposase [Leptospira yanagawae serovar Saopaulo str. Sao Paulo = ATCC 700523]EOQ87189.1 transposase [Leptospira yanagawae serovar Saopaulo str. Sao Paulo = ATCC 700523]EOQ87219.1 transposase [Leptospira yanagawae serovar Saopaulo str. Sao Paulo = ATCC 700523]EOQ87382.1 transposase [Leptospira yanagawae serovar Saopaulo str. Sao Paulo = ATCC 700523]EOQ87386.1 transposase [Leptospira yanagawae serovar Saopaulo str. Sao Paulo = ATCC 700523]
MARKKIEESEIFRILKEAETGIPIKELSRKYGITEQTFYRWRNKYGGMELSEIKKMKALEQENSNLKRLVADMALEIQAIKNVLGKKF